MTSERSKCRDFLSLVFIAKSYETLESTGEIKRTFFPVFAQFIGTLKFIFSELLQATIYISLALRKCKKYCKIPKIILVKAFRPLKTEIARFPIGFRLNGVQKSSNDLKPEHDF